MDPGFGSEIRNRVPGLRLWFRFLWQINVGSLPCISPNHLRLRLLRVFKLAGVGSYTSS